VKQLDTDFKSNGGKYRRKQTPSPPVDIIWAMMIVWRKIGKIIRTVLCCVVYNWYAHTHTHMSSS